MLENLFGIGTLVHLLDETLLREVLELGTPLLSVGKGRDALESGEQGRQREEGGYLGGDEEEGTEGRTLHVRGLAFTHLHQHDAGGPDVHLDAVGMATDELGSHPIGCAHHSVPLCPPFGQLRCVAEVGQLYLAPAVDQDVVRPVACDKRKATTQTIKQRQQNKTIKQRQ